MIRIKVPATTANLGPGYDTCGMALSIYNTFTISDSNEKYDYKNNLIHESFSYIFNLKAEKVPNIKIDVDAEIPIARGLGSSATCIVAGLMAANSYLNYEYSEMDILRFATDIEGHPDNVAPAILGGLIIASALEDEVIYYKSDVSDEFKFHVIIPDFTLSTQEARKVVPKQVKLEDAISNIAMSNLLTRAIEIGDYELFKKTAKDRLHEPFRKNLIFGFDIFKSLVEKNGGVMLLSGAGPTMLAVAQRDNKNINKALKNHSIKEHNYEILELEISGGASYI